METEQSVHCLSDLWIQRVRTMDMPGWMTQVPSLSQQPHRAVVPYLEADFLHVCDDAGRVGFWGPIDPVCSLLLLWKIRPCVLSQTFTSASQALERVLLDERHARSGWMMVALSSFELAIWDLLGKVHNCPVYQLLGGSAQEVACYASLLRYDLTSESASSLAKEAMSAGFYGTKWCVSVAPEAKTMESNIEALMQIRETVGEGPLMIDALGTWTLSEALEYCELLTDLNLTWVEEPLPPFQWSEYRTLAGYTEVPIAAGEHVYNCHEARMLLDSGVAVLQPDSRWCGGLTGLQQIFSTAKQEGRQLAPHGGGLISSLHACAVANSSLKPTLEYHFTIEPMRQLFFENPILPVGGYLSVPERPGFGVELRTDGLASKRICIGSEL